MIVVSQCSTGRGAFPTTGETPLQFNHFQQEHLHDEEEIPLHGFQQENNLKPIERIAVQHAAVLIGLRGGELLLEPTSL